MSNTENKKEDPISENLYNPLEKAKKASEILFWTIAALSLLPIALTLLSHPTIKEIISYLLIINIILLIISIILSLVIRLYLFPRAEDARRKDFISDTFKVQLINLRTKGYYNNEECRPSIRMGLSTLEDLLYTKRVLQSMIIRMRIKAFVWLIIFVALILHRGPNLEAIYTVTLVVFSENIFIKWARMEWILAKTEMLFENTYRILQLKLSEDNLFPLAIDAFVDYETDKATAGVLSSSKIFGKLQQLLDEEWEKIKTNLSRSNTEN